jgi:hypothetical protein
MVGSNDLLVALLFGGVGAVLFFGMAGIRRIRWRYAALMGAGYAIVLAALWFAMFRSDNPILVLVGGLGGVLAQRGFGEGMQERNRISEEITRRQTAPPIT